MREEILRDHLSSLQGVDAYGTDKVVIILRLILHLRFLATFVSADASVAEPYCSGSVLNRYRPSYRTLTFEAVLSKFEHFGGRLFSRRTLQISILATSNSLSTVVLYWYSTGLHQ
jgi:hypothetical protein